MNIHLSIPPTAPAAITYEDTLPGLVDLYLAIDAIAEAAYTPDVIMDAIGNVRDLLRNEVTNRTAITDLDVVAKLRLAAHLIADPETIWPQDRTLLLDAIERLTSRRMDILREFLQEEAA